MNKLTLVGNVVKMNEMRTVNTANGPTKVIDFRFAANNQYNRDKKIFVKCTAWRGLAETFAKYVSDGQKLYLAGPIEAKAYMGKDNMPHAQVEMQIEDFEFAGSSGGGMRAESAPAPQAVTNPMYTTTDPDEIEEEDDEYADLLPF